ncbi:hypothetical protein ACFLUG_00600 [Chloroflexota bacterium]
MKKLILTSIVLALLLNIFPAAVPVAHAADNGIPPAKVQDLALAIEKRQLELAHEMAYDILRQHGYKKTGNSIVDVFIDYERYNIMSKVQQKTFEEIIARHGENSIEGIVNIGSHARAMNSKYVIGKSDLDFIILGEKSTEADELFRVYLAQEMGIDNVDTALSRTLIGPSNDNHFNKLQEVKSMEEALSKGQDDMFTFMQRLKDPNYAEYYKTYGSDKFIENYNWMAGSYDRIDILDGKVTVVRDPGTVIVGGELVPNGEPTVAMRKLYNKMGWSPPEMAFGDSWGLATNEYYFMQREIKELADLNPYQRAMKLSKRAERFNKALGLTGMPHPNREFITQTNFLRKGGVISDEAAELYLTQLDEMAEVTLERTLKAKMFNDLGRGWHPKAVTGELTGEALEATIKFAETRKFLETTFGMNLIGREKSEQLMSSLDVPDYFRGAIKEEYGRALALADDIEQYSRFIDRQAAGKMALLETIETAEDAARMQGFLRRFISSTGGRMTLEGLDIGFRLFTVYDAYERGGWNSAANRAVLEGGAKWLAWKGISRADLALLVFDLSTMTIQAVGDTAMEEMRDVNVMGIYTGVIPPRETGYVFFAGLKKDATPDYTSLFQYLNISGLSQDTRAQIRSRLEGSQGFKEYIEKKASWWEKAYGLSDERKEELKDFYVSTVNINHMRGELFSALQDKFEQRVAVWNEEHGSSIYSDENAAELNKLIDGLIDGVITGYRQEHLAEIEAGGAWKGLDEATWKNIRGMIASDFSSGWSNYLEKKEEERQIAQAQRDMEDMADTSGNLLNTILGAGEAVSKIPEDLLEMLNAAFGLTPGAETGGLKVSVSPETAFTGDTIDLTIDTGTMAGAIAEITITGSSGESLAIQADIPEEGKLSLPILDITESNLTVWEGVNIVTISVETGAGEQVTQLEASTSFTVVTEPTLRVTATPDPAGPGDEVEFKIQVFPAQPITVQLTGNIELENREVTTDDNGLYRFTVNAPADTGGSGSSYYVIANASLPGTDGEKEIQGTGSFSVIKELGLRFSAEPGEAGSGDTIRVSGSVNPEIPANLEITMRNNDSGYSTSFNDFTNSDGTFEIPVLEITTGNLGTWNGDNTVTIAARATTGTSSISAESIAYFTVESGFGMVVNASPERAVAGEEITVTVQINPPVTTPLEITGDIEEPVNTQTDSSGTYRLTIPVTSREPKYCEVSVTAPELGLTGRSSFNIEMLPLANATEVNFSLGLVNGVYTQVENGVTTSISGEAGYGHWFTNGTWEGNMFTAVNTPDAGTRFSIRALFDDNRQTVLSFEMTAEQGMGTDEGFYFRVTGHEIPVLDDGFERSYTPYQIEGNAVCGYIDTIERRSWRPGFEQTLRETQCHGETSLRLLFN